MANDRKLRRAERERRHQEVLEKRAREDVRRRKLRTLRRKVTLQEMRRRSAGRLTRRNRAERAILFVVGGLALILIWQLVHNTALQIALTLLVVLALPIFAIIAFDKKGS